MRKSKLWKHPYHSGVDWSAENEAKSFGFPSHAAFVAEMEHRSKGPFISITTDELRKRLVERIGTLTDKDYQEMAILSLSPINKITPAEGAVLSKLDEKLFPHIS